MALFLIVSHSEDSFLFLVLCSIFNKNATQHNTHMDTVIFYILSYLLSLITISLCNSCLCSISLYWVFQFVGLMQFLNYKRNIHKQQKGFYCFVFVVVVV